MASQVKRYAFINAKLRARISKLLTEDLLERFVDAPTLKDALAYLRGTPYGLLEEIYNKTGDVKSCEFELFKQEVELYREIEGYMEGYVVAVVRALATSYEIENLKNALRCFFSRKIREQGGEEELEYLYKEKIIHEFDPVRVATAQNFTQIVEELRLTPYAQILEDCMDSVEKEASLFPVEVAFDHYYYRNLIASTEKLSRVDRKEALRLFGIEIDLQNINWIIRFKSFYNLPLEKVMSLSIPSGFRGTEKSIIEAYTSQSIRGILEGIVKRSYPGVVTLLSTPVEDTHSRLLLIERILEEILSHEVLRILSGYPFTIGIILSYLILKKNEVRRIRTIFLAKQLKLSKERIRGLI